MIAPSLALIGYRTDLRPGLEARPAWALVDRLLPSPPELRIDLNDRLDLNGPVKRKLGDADRGAGVAPGVAPDVEDQLREAVDDGRQLVEARGALTSPSALTQPVTRSRSPSSARSEAKIAESSEARGLRGLLHGDVVADLPADERLRPVDGAMARDVGAAPSMRTSSNLNSTPAGAANGAGSSRPSSARRSSIRPIGPNSSLEPMARGRSRRLPRHGTGERARSARRALDRAEMSASACGRCPGPSRLDAPLSTPSRGAGKKLTPRRRRLGIETVGDLLRARPARLPRPHRRSRKLGELRIGEEATVIAEVRSARVRPTRRRNLRIVEATVADETRSAEGGLVQPGLARGKAAPRRPRAAPRQARPRGPSGVEPRDRREGAGATGIHTLGIVPVHSATDGLPANRLREWAWQAMPPARVEEVEPLPAELRARRGMPLARDAVAGRALPGHQARTRASPASAWRSRSSSSTRSRWRRAGGRARVGRPGVALELAGRTWSRAGSTRSRSSPPAGSAGARRDRRGPRLGPADAAAADGRGRQRQDRASRSTRCSAPSRAATRRR